MGDEVIIKVEGEETLAETAETVIETAVEIAEMIDEARQEGSAETAEIQQMKYSIDDLWSMINALSERVGVVADLVMGVSDQVAALSAIEVAEILEENTETEVVEIAETAEEIAEAIPEQEPVETAVTPQIREKKSRRNFI